jgi:hypothetical protein
MWRRPKGAAPNPNAAVMAGNALQGLGGGRGALSIVRTPLTLNVPKLNFMPMLRALPSTPAATAPVAAALGSRTDAPSVTGGTTGTSPQGTATLHIYSPESMNSPTAQFSLEIESGGVRVHTEQVVRTMSSTTMERGGTLPEPADSKPYPLTNPNAALQRQADGLGKEFGPYHGISNNCLGELCEIMTRGGVPNIPQSGHGRIGWAKKEFPNVPLQRRSGQ